MGAIRIGISGWRYEPWRGVFSPSLQRPEHFARKNVKKAVRSARADRTIAQLPKKTRNALGKKGAAAAKKKRTARG